MITPHPTALAVSQELTEYICQEIRLSAGYISFARFMELALYAPGLGYYSAGAQKLGREGDFVTAPEISPLFAQCVAHQCQQILAALPGGDILEIGAGSGKFAKDLLLELEKQNTLPVHYYILEVSADLRARQIELLQNTCPHLLPRINWLNTLPTSLTGIIVANEVLDAMPVHRFIQTSTGLKECGVHWINSQFAWHQQTPSIALQHALATIIQECPLENGYQSEVSLLHPAWIASLAAILQQGCLLLIDYGYGRREYYHPERTQGTLSCFYQHHQHTDPLSLIGLQDISAHVDFTLIAESAVAAGLTVSGFTTQAAFLLACGLLDLAEQTSGSMLEKHQQSQQIKTLTLPTEMGNIIKVMGLSKQFDLPLLGFSLQDSRRDL